MSSPTRHTLEHCRKRGWIACVVEKWIRGKNIRVDVLGFGDVLALDGQPGSLLIQTTTTDNAPARVKKIKTERRDNALAWLEAGNRIVVHGWALRGAAGKRKLWTLKEYDVTMETLEGGE